jgi:hypothetical protein
VEMVNSYDRSRRTYEIFTPFKYEKSFIFRKISWIYNHVMI